MILSPRFELIVAYDLDGVIGLSSKNALPWHVPEDLAHFRRITTETPDSILVMGRRTFESFGGKTLKGRIHVVLTRAFKNLESTSQIHFTDLDNVFPFLEKYNQNRVFVIGGREIYKMFIGLCYRIHVTKIFARSGGDVCFSCAIDSNLFEIQYRSRILESRSDNVHYQFVTYQYRTPIADYVSGQL
jgi:dihydrofolate reductase